MRATMLFAGATLAMVIAAPRAARSAGGVARTSGGALVLTVGARSLALTKARALAGLVPAGPGAGMVGAALAVPQLALAVARESSSLEMSVAPAYAKIGRSRSAALALSGRF
jgi:hypothetical protein